jgi:DNA processing protein
VSDPRLPWLGFHLTKGIGPSRLERLLDHFGDLSRAWNATPGELERAGLGEVLRANVAAARRTWDLDRELARVEAAGVTLLTRDDPGYPARLRQIAGAPPVLYVKGALTPADDLALGIVGTRRATAYGREVTMRLAGELAAAGLTIVSGLAKGVDACAHDAALRAGGRTIAFLGSGVDVIYPAEHRALAARIANGGQGALVSEYHLGTTPDAPNFPARNRLISGMSLGVLVTEAPLRSGALITTDFAAEQGRDVFAVPGSILSPNSAGPNELLKEGARPVTCAEDILEELNLVRQEAQAETRRALPENDDERAVLRMLGDGPTHVNDLSQSSGLPVAALGSLLMMLELKGMVRQLGVGQYVRV